MTKNIYQCKNCQEKFIPKDKRYSIFCSQSCSASYNNKGKKKSKETKEKISKTISSISDIKMKTCKWKLFLKYFVWGDFTKIIKNKCSFCNKIFYNRKNIKYCKNHSNMYMKNNRGRYEFTFNVYNYPDLFDLNLLNEKGWYSPKGKSGKWNPKGLTRDHKISKTEAVRNNYDPYYIKHPLNCQLLTQIENNRKRTNNSINYEELVKMINEWDISKK